MYDTETTAKLIALYNAGTSVEELTKIFGKSAKSIVGKLSKERVYKKKTYTTKQGTAPETKKHIIARIAEQLSIDPERIQGLEKAPKIELLLVLSSIRAPAKK